MGRANADAAVVVLTPAESRRLIARAVAALPQVRRAMANALIIIGNGTTNAYVAEELLGIALPKIPFAAGLIRNGALDSTDDATRLKPIVIERGKQVDVAYQEALGEFGGEDVFIKGANAVDPRGRAGVLMGSDIGGTIGACLALVTARGSHLIMPVGLEKLVPDVVAASRACGIHRLSQAMGHKVGLMPVATGRVITEVQAFEILGGVRATHVASGGVDGSEGSVVLALEGEPAAVEAAFGLAQAVKGEPPVTEG